MNPSKPDKIEQPDVDAVVAAKIKQRQLENERRPNPLISPPPDLPPQYGVPG
jgi:hypothetical protein